MALSLRTRTPGARALLPATRCQSSGPLGALLSSPALDVRLMTALQVLQVLLASTHTALVSSPSLAVLHLSTSLSLLPREVLEVDILWPRWVARIGVTRATEACFLTADRQCTELPLLRLPRLVLEFHGSGPMRQTNPRPSAGGLEGARCKEGLCKKPIPVVRPTPPHRAA